MKNIAEKSWIFKMYMGIFSLVLVFALGLFWEPFSMVTYAQSQCKVTANSANIRKEPSTGSTVLGSAAKNASLTINHQTTASDGTVWYQVFVDAQTLGYIRSDLVSITDGSTPNIVEASNTTAGTTTPTPTTPVSASTETPASVTPVESVSASVTGGENVRVRSNASTTSQIVTTVSDGSALTVTGQATGSDGNVWYQVAFIANGADVTGFIRYDYVKLSAELTPATGNTTEEPDSVPEEPVEEQKQEEEPKEEKAWETQLQGDKWYLLDMENSGQYVIGDLFSAIEQNGNAYDESQKTVKSQKMVILILVMVVVVLCIGVTLLLFKIKDINDSAYFSEVERDAVRRRNVDRPQSNQKVMHTVGSEKRNVQGSRPMQQGERPIGGRPMQPQGERPIGSRPMQPQGERPIGSRPMQPRGEKEAVQQSPNSHNSNRKSKNFIMDDDEFEFEFLNWDGEDE